jgi:hypothetical protein
MKLFVVIAILFMPSVLHADGNIIVPPLAEQAMQSQYSTLYSHNKNTGQKLFKDGKTFEDIVSRIKSYGQNNKFVESSNKNNMAFARAMYEGLCANIVIIDNILVDTVERGILKTKIYREILAERNRLDAIRNDIFDFSFNYEKQLFKKATGRLFYIVEDRNGSNDPRVSLQYPEPLKLSPWWTAPPGYIFSLAYTMIFQTVDNNGVLVKNIGDDSQVAYLATNISLVDGASLSGYYAYPAGTYSYKSFYGQRKVAAYKLLQFKNQKTAGIQFYFYPNILDISNIDIINDSMYYNDKTQKTNKKKHNRANTI